MMLPSTIDTVTLRKLTGYSKAAITDLENAHVIKREATNAWPIDTVTKIIAYLRDRVRRNAVSDERSRWERARAQREEMRVRREAGDLCRVSDFDAVLEELGHAILARLQTLPARIGGNDRALRERAQTEVDGVLNAISIEMSVHADRLEGKQERE